MKERDSIPQPDQLPGQIEASRGTFNTTHWSVVLLAGQDGTPEGASALEKLCRMYWYPLYAYARREGHDRSDGQDLTQQFFAVCFEKNSFSLADPDRGRFRNFLLTSFKHFLTNEHHRHRAAKRGGGCRFVSWDEAEVEARYQQELATEASPDKLFEQAWALTLLDKVMKDLRQEYVCGGKANVFDALQVFLTGDRSEATYEEIGKGLRKGESAVKMAVSRLRRRYGEMLRSEIARTVTEPGVVEDELRQLIGALRR